VKILITGGAGYIGSVLVEHLLDKKHFADITVLDTFRHRQPSLAHLVHDPRLEIVAGDARDPYVVKPLVEAADVILPLAAIVGAPACEQDHGLAWSTNLSAVNTILGYARPEQKIVIPTTNSFYGKSEEVCTEESPVNPLSQYAASKLSAEDAVLKHPRGCSLRLATAFGASPRMRLDLLLNDWVYRALRDRHIVVYEGHFRRNFVHVRDIASAFLHAIEKNLTGVYNVGNDAENLSKNGLAMKLEEEISDFRWTLDEYGKDPDKRNYEVSSEKFVATGWNAKYSVKDGILELKKLYSGLRNEVYSNA
jgi:nucleoside-diphosphate-sugar epimerase